MQKLLHAVVPGAGKHCAARGKALQAEAVSMVCDDEFATNSKYFAFMHALNVKSHVTYYNFLYLHLSL